MRYSYQKNLRVLLQHMDLDLVLPALNNVPAEEGREWERFWSEVETLLQKSGGGAREPTTQRADPPPEAAPTKSQSKELLRFGTDRSFWLNRVAFTPDGRYALATGGAVILYDLQTGAEVRRTLELTYACCALALTRDGRYFVTGHQNDRVVRMGQVQSGRVVRTFTGHTDGVYAVALSPDEQWLASGGNDRTLRLWEVATGKELRQFEGVTDTVRTVAFSPDGTRLAAGPHGAGNTGEVRLWDVSGGKPVRSFRGHSKDVTAVLFIADGRQLLSADLDGAIIIRDGETGTEIRRMIHKGGVHRFTRSPFVK
jgi:WD40 repeat protein